MKTPQKPKFSKYVPKVPVEVPLPSTFPKIEDIRYAGWRLGGKTFDVDYRLKPNGKYDTFHTSDERWIREFIRTFDPNWDGEKSKYHFNE